MSVRNRLAVLTPGVLAAACLFAVAAPASAAPTPSPSPSPTPTATRTTATGTASLALSPTSGPAGTRVTATFRISGLNRCPVIAARFLWDNTDLGVAPVDQSTCRSGLTFAAPAGTGGHTVTGRGVGTTYVARAGFTLSAPAPTRTATAAAQPTPSRTASASPRPSVSVSPPPAPSAVLVETDAPIPGSDGGAFNPTDPFSLGYILGGVILLLGVIAGIYAAYRFRRTAAARFASLRRRSP